ncbi:hypothetical protein WJU23_03120 [Prosthecobacter sp. SYSU 5D2]|uniref:hypothetical protein n=1 Tax=Prosthecobacter sp. SYSU 5D2 TaxID=3134134 RepID=UPI0031FEAA6B
MSEKTKAKISEQKLALRQRVWPDITEEDLWIRKARVGFTTIPRILPLMAVIMDSLSKNKPVSSTYFDLWCRAYDECFVVLNKQPEMAFHSGFSGQRAVQTWSERIKILDKLGFIKVASGPNGPLSYVLILNPYKVVQRVCKTKPDLIREDLQNALHERAIEIGATDLEDVPAIPAQEQAEEAQKPMQHTARKRSIKDKG